MKGRWMAAVWMAWLLAPAVTALGASLAASPQTIRECDARGYGRTRLYWSADAGPLEIRIGGPDGPVLAQSNDRSGSEATGNWVNDGASFHLVDERGQELARTTVRVACAIPQGVPPAVPDYLPLEIGNQWIYRYDTRFATGGRQVWTVTRVEPRGGRSYFVLSRDGVEARYRRDAEGRIWEAGPEGQDVLWLDPTAGPDPAAVQQPSTRNHVISGPTGVFTEVIGIDRFQGALLHTNSNYAPGVGLVSQTNSLATGSSGGLTDGLTLLSARVGGRVYGAPQVSVSLAVEQQNIVMRPDAAPNCALPCYYAACGIGSPVDPPGTFRPCIGAFLTLHSSGFGPAQLAVRDPKIFELILTASDGTVVWRRPERAGAERAAKVLTVGPSPLTLTESVPLYTKPNEPFPPGRYSLSASLEADDGRLYSATLPVTIAAGEP